LVFFPSPPFASVAGFGFRVYGSGLLPAEGSKVGRFLRRDEQIELPAATEDRQARFDADAVSGQQNGIP
jgi:hypothetical protein